MEGNPIVHKWIVEREKTTVGLNGLVITGTEAQKVAIVPFEPGNTFRDGVIAVTNPPLEEYRSYLDTAMNDEDNLLWSKQLNYEITCSLFHCTKRYHEVN